MRIRIAALFSACVALTAPRAWAQAPGQVPPTPPGMTAGPTQIAGRSASGLGSMSLRQGDGFTNGTVAPALSLGYAAYRGKSTRLLVIGGVGFGYEARQLLQGVPATNPFKVI